MFSVDERNLFTLTVALLTAGLYYSWSKDMEIVFRGKGLWKFVAEISPKAVESQSESPTSRN